MISKLDSILAGERAILHEINVACFEGPERPNVRQFNEMLDNCDVWVITSNSNAGLIVGFAVVSLSSLFSPYLWHIAIAPNCQGHGLSRRLLRAICSYYASQGYKSMHLHCNTKNMRAIGLYNGERFEVTAVAEDHYAPGVHALSMRREL